MSVDLQVATDVWRLPLAFESVAFRRCTFFFALLSVARYVVVWLFTLSWPALAVLPNVVRAVALGLGVVSAVFAVNVWRGVFGITNAYVLLQGATILSEVAVAGTLSSMASDRFLNFGVLWPHRVQLTCGPQVAVALLLSAVLSATVLLLLLHTSDWMRVNRRLARTFSRPLATVTPA